MFPTACTCCVSQELFVFSAVGSRTKDWYGTKSGEILKLKCWLGKTVVSETQWRSIIRDCIALVDGDIDGISRM